VQSEHPTYVVRVEDLAISLGHPALIDHHGFAADGGTLSNKINSISPKNAKFLDYVQMGIDVLQSVHYF
jgi:hypothetical protein